MKHRTNKDLNESYTMNRILGCISFFLWFLTTIVFVITYYTLAGFLSITLLILFMGFIDASVQLRMNYESREKFERLEHEIKTYAKGKKPNGKQHKPGKKNSKKPAHT